MIIITAATLFFKIYLFNFIFGCVGSSLLRAGFSLVAASGGYSLLRCTGLSLRWLLLLRSTGSRHMGFSSCGARAQQLWLAGSRAQAQWLWCTGLAASRHVGSSRTRARTRVPCIGRQILNHCATREAPLLHLCDTFCVPGNVLRAQVYYLIQLYKVGTIFVLLNTQETTTQSFEEGAIFIPILQMKKKEI